MAALRALMRLQLASGASRRGSTIRSSLRTRRPAALAAVGGAAVASCCCCYYYYRHSSSSPESGSATRRERRYRLGLPSGDVFAPLSVPTVEASGRAKNVLEESDIEDVELYVSSQEQRFRLFTSLEYEGQLYMTPRDFIESVTTDEPRGFRPRKSLSKQELENMLAETPPVWKGSSRLFRTLHDRGLIAYTEYLFLLCILTKPHAGFKIAFNMFDTDGNEMVDKKEFLVLQEIFRKKNEKRGRRGDDEEKSAQVRAEENFFVDTTLLVHFFGRRGKAELNFDDFYKFMDNIQTEILETEFLSYSKGMTTISEEDFARILLRYTNVDNTSTYLESVRQRIPEEKGITFDEFRSFFQFLNNLEDFAIAMQMYNFANRSIGQDEFKRAVYVATGLKLSSHLVNTVFKIFDVDKDDQLSYKEFIGVMKDRLHRGFRGYKSTQGYPSFKVCLKKEFVTR
ncbi:calcium uptake protein 3, mitochondrial-like isoform X3 [Hemiscyllium ocellatum]|uniref:calcium uptake protein 3, mitochondrial-like isoform X3 n=1 Tax=Hemiscyllium ocellatum TaxID=170820 RepID=UPI002965DB1F|nr:calcium uptake protein 3, mitochondrial-like isoform X3 [Hemiscyllium ocellatum]